MAPPDLLAVRASVMPGVVDSVLDLIGATPLVRLGVLGADLPGEVLVKLEGRNPGGSAKDRPALAMIRSAETTGELAPGMTIVESTSGNTGVGLALVGRVTGHPVVLVHGAGMSAEKRAAARAYGAELVEADWTALPDDDANPRRVADRIALERGGWRPLQYDNPGNASAHAAGTGPEIWAQTAGRVTHLVAGIGTGGTITGTGRHLKAVSEGRVRVIGVNPEGSTYGGGVAGPVRVEGVGTTWPATHWPRTFDTEVPDEVRTVPDDATVSVTEALGVAEALLLGPSSGMAVAAALDVAACAEPGSVVVVISPDDGRNYFSTAGAPR